MCIDYTQLCCTSKLENCSENEVGTEFELKYVQGCMNVVSVCKIDHSLYQPEWFTTFTKADFLSLDMHSLVA